MGFWENAINGGGQQPAAPVAPAQPPPVTQQAWWRDPSGEPPPQQYAQPQQQGPVGLDGQPLAVANYRSQQADQVVDRIVNQGFIQKPPDWVKKQPNLYCTECQGVNFSQEHGRCFDCGYTTRGIGGHLLVGGRINEFSGITGGGPVIARARQTAEGGARLQNFGEITG